MLVNEYYGVQRSRNQGRYWSNLTHGMVCLTEKHAREYMESLHREHPSDWYRIVRYTEEAEAGYFGKETYDMKSHEENKSRPDLVAEWKLGPEYEFAYCSHCGHMEHAGWDTHREAAEMIGTFHEKYKFCPNCGAKMEGVCMSSSQDVGNAAAIREALTKVSEWMAHRIATGGFEASPTIPTVLEDVVLPALAKPPRNCDKYPSLDEAQNAYMAINELPEGNRDEDMRQWFCDFLNWLFAPATEQKGDK